MTQFQVPCQASLPRDTSELAEAELIVLMALRRWVMGHRTGDPRHWSLAWNDIASSFGSYRGRTALNALVAVIGVICRHARRPIGHHQPCCRCVGADEVCILSLIAACQRAEALAASALAEWIVMIEGVPELLTAADRLGAILGDQGHQLPQRQTLSRKPRPREAYMRPIKATLH